MLAVYAAIVVLVVAIYFLNPVWRWRFRHIPGLSPYPFLGNLVEIISASSVGDVIEQNRKRYGPVMKLFFGRTPLAFVTEPELAKQILSSSFTSFPGRGLETLLPRPLPKDTKVLDELGVFEAVGDNWKTLRPHWSNYLSNESALKHYSKLMDEGIEKLLVFFRAAAARSEPVDVLPLVQTLTVEIVGTTAFGVSFSEDSLKEGKKPPLVDAAVEIIKSLGANDPFTILSVCAPILTPVLRVLSPVVNGGVVRARRELVRLCLRMVREVRGRSGSDAVSGGPRDGLLSGSFLSMLSKVTDKGTGEPLDEVNISAQAAIMVLAGYETTAGTLSMALWALAAHPEAQAKLIQEIDEQAAQGNGGDQSRDFAKYPFLDAVVNETLRLWGPAGWIARKCSKETELAGKRIYPGMLVAACMWAIHRDPEQWGLDASEFRPERFLEGTARHPFAFMPFGGGPRVCPGKHFALLEVKMALLRIFEEFRMEAREGVTTLPIRTKENFTTGPACPVKLVPVARKLK